MYTEIGILVCVILAVSLFHNVYTSSVNVLPVEENFESKNYLETLGKVDLRVERKKLLDELSRVDVATHEYAPSSDRSSVRVGLERMIAEVDRALETEGRYLDTKTMEAILNAGRRPLV